MKIEDIHNIIDKLTGLERYCNEYDYTLGKWWRLSISSGKLYTIEIFERYVVGDEIIQNLYDFDESMFIISISCNDLEFMKPFNPIAQMREQKINNLL